MNRRWVSLAVLMGAILVGCGGVEPTPASAPEGVESVESVSQELVSCSTYCPYDGSTKSCSGNTCSAKNGDWVQCDGQYQYCPVAPYCPYSNSCEGLHGMSCSPNRATIDCCIYDGGGTGGGEGTCFCSGGTWTCPI